MLKECMFLLYCTQKVQEKNKMTQNKTTTQTQNEFKGSKEKMENRKPLPRYLMRELEEENARGISWKVSQYVSEYEIPRKYVNIALGVYKSNKRNYLLEDTASENIRHIRYYEPSSLTIASRMIGHMGRDIFNKSFEVADQCLQLIPEEKIKNLENILSSVKTKLTTSVEPVRAKYGKVRNYLADKYYQAKQNNSTTQNQKELKGGNE